MIELKNLCKTYHTANKEIVALDGINLTIHDGEIFGIIGLSGAGKSTLVRCINLLEVPTGGEVIIDGQSLTKLPRKALLKLRQQIGMIFQGFNLLEQRNVIRNICFPLEIAGVKKTAPRSCRKCWPSARRWCCWTLLCRDWMRWPSSKSTMRQASATPPSS